MDTHRGCWVLGCVALLACGGELEITQSGAGDDEVVDTEAELTGAVCQADKAEALLRVVQCNIWEGGQWPRDEEGQVSWATARALAENIRAQRTPAIIGFQEMNERHARNVHRIFNELMPDDPWEKTVVTMGVGEATGSGVAIFWRPSKVTPVKDLGVFEFKPTLPNGYHLRFMGKLFQKKGTSYRLGFFTGKFSWGGAWGSFYADNSARVREARQLTAWIDQVMAPYPNAARVIATDLNASPESAPWRELDKRFWDGGAFLPTWPNAQLRQLPPPQDFTPGVPLRRLDHLFWAGGWGPKQACGIQRVGRTRYFGSDHRAVYADLYAR